MDLRRLRERVIGIVPGDAALHLEVEGEGPAVVLLHGFGGSARNWRPQLRALRGEFRVAAFDVRGHARSDAPRDAASYRPACFVSDVGRVFDHLGIERAVVGGLSMGAGIAARFAAAHPERVRGIVLAALPPGAQSPPDHQAEGNRQRSWALAFAAAIDRKGLEAAGARYAWGPESGLDASAAKLVRMGFLEHAPHAIAHTLRELLAVQPGWSAIAESLRPLDLPVLVIVGERDPVSLAPCRKLAEAIPRAELLVVPGAGHVVNLEARDAVNAALRSFLARIPPP
jgi:2-succinyl-6-hydroxy-2,4-cyclohexadiene-1-carboxylate synthase